MGVLFFISTSIGRRGEGTEYYASRYRLTLSRLLVKEVFENQWHASRPSLRFTPGAVSSKKLKDKN
jgi:hypothetical protein